MLRRVCHPASLLLFAICSQLTAAPAIADSDPAGRSAAGIYESVIQLLVAPASQPARRGPAQGRLRKIDAKALVRTVLPPARHLLPVPESARRRFAAAPATPLPVTAVRPLPVAAARPLPVARRPPVAAPPPLPGAARSSRTGPVLAARQASGQARTSEGAKRRETEPSALVLESGSALALKCDPALLLCESGNARHGRPAAASPAPP